MIKLTDFRLIPPSPDVPKQYMVKWSGEPSKLFLVITSIKPVLTINGRERAVTLESEPFKESVPIHQTNNPLPHELPRLPISTFSFELYDNDEGSGDGIAKEEAFIGQRICFAKKAYLYQDDFVRVTLSCDYKIPKDLFWLKLTNRYPNIKFPLPEMQPCQEGFQTAFLMKSDAYSLVEINFHEKVKEMFVFS